MVLTTAAILAGCSDPYAGRMEVTGKVTLVGEPLPDGIIRFEPVEKSVGTPSGSMIENGGYKVPRKQGLKPGKYIVSISSGDGKTPVNAEDMAPGPSANITSVDRVPEDWNIRSNHEVEVKSSPPNNFDFNIDHYNPKYRPKKK
jgi:hypothetical protein